MLTMFIALFAAAAIGSCIATLAHKLFAARQFACDFAPTPSFAAILASFDAAEGRKALMALVPMAPRSTAPAMRYQGCALRPSMPQRARIALRWLVAGSVALRALRRPLRLVTARGVALAMVVALLAVGTVACGVRTGMSHSDTKSFASTLASILRADRASKVSK